jgi:hypothetical protein
LTCRPARGREEWLAIGIRQVEGIGQRAQGMGIRSPPLTALEGADGIRGQAGPLSQLLLRHTSGITQSTEPSSERHVLNGAHPV